MHPFVLLIGLKETDKKLYNPVSILIFHFSRGGHVGNENGNGRTGK